MMAPGHGDLPLVKRVIDEAMRPVGINILVLEVNDGPEFQSHPELRRSHGFSRADDRDSAAYCRQRGIDLIPQLNCLGHQYWARTTAPLEKVPDWSAFPAPPPTHRRARPRTRRPYPAAATAPGPSAPLTHPREDYIVI